MRNPTRHINYEGINELMSTPNKPKEGGNNMAQINPNNYTQLVGNLTSQPIFNTLNSNSPYGTAGTAYPQVQQQIWSTTLSTPQYVEGLALIAEELGVEPISDLASNVGLVFTAEDGKSYSLFAILRAHLDLMKHLHILAAHTNLLIPKVENV